MSRLDRPTSRGLCYVLLFLSWISHCIAVCPGHWAPCACVNGLINCRNKNLTDLISFTSSSERFHTLDFSVNQLRRIGPNAFAALSNGNFTALLLQSNFINYIDPGAFNGIENTLKVLNLRDNALHVLPDAIRHLNVITNLDVSWNPIDGTESAPHSHHVNSGFSFSVMNAIGDTLTSFAFGEPIELKHWPRELSSLVGLQKLHVDGAAIQVFSSDFFHGFEQTLHTLTIERARLVQMPLALKDMTHLEELHIDHNYADDGNSMIIESVLNDLSDTLHTLSFKYDKITVFPEAIKHLVNLKNLSLEGNPLEFIGEDAISFIQSTPVSILSFRNCNLTRIPGSMSDVRNLIEIDFSQNRISSIENNDLFNLPNLRKISFAGNPLIYISRNSFHGLDSVEFMDLSNSNMTVISEAIQNLAGLQVLDLTNSRIDCTCDLYWVKRWLVIYNRHLTINGQCETIDQSVQDYIDNRVPTCIQYSHA